MNRGRRREKIFFNEKDYRVFLEILGKSSKLYSIEIHAYVLMPNHYHLLIKTPKGNISRAMRHINGVYTQIFNKRNKIDGSLFRGRYKSILVEEEEYLLELVRYIHRNPIKSGLEDDLGEYEWCSHKGYEKDNKREEWLKTEEVLRKFSKYDKEARGELEAFVKEEMPKDLLKRLEGVNWPAILGGNDFKEKIKEYIRGKELKEVPEYKKEIVMTNKREDLIEGFVEEYGDILKEKGKRKDGEISRALIYIMRKELGMKLLEISEICGGIRYSGVSNQYKKAEKEMGRREGCYLRVKEIMSRM
ncbi:MAG: transposase [Candidatus Omnitrophota bacterium]